MSFKILHIAKDDKFFDNLMTSFESDDRVENYSVVIDETKSTFKYIKKTNRVVSVSIIELKQIMKEGNYDAVYYHSIAETVWRTVSWIPYNKIIIWWSWGYDLYISRLPYFRPLINIDLYKEQTRKYIETSEELATRKVDVIKYLTSLIKARYLERCRRKALSRIDLFIPVISEEYKILVREHGLKAQLFSNPKSDKKIEFKPSPKAAQLGNILLGNSATLTNNHLDVWQVLQSKNIYGRTIILPVSYGDDKYREYLKETIRSDSNKIVFLQDFLSYDEYNKMMDSCLYALFGVIRQQAMGNVFLCLQRGIKLFFFEDSMVYRFLKNIGCYVFTIESLDESEISTPLSMAEAEHNFKVWMKYRNSCSSLYKSIINNILEKC